jgi:hypothetical protein
VFFVVGIHGVQNAYRVSHVKYLRRQSFSTITSISVCLQTAGLPTTAEGWFGQPQSSEVIGLHVNSNSPMQLRQASEELPTDSHAPSLQMPLPQDGANGGATMN